jgi:hypothetical protein
MKLFGFNLISYRNLGIGASTPLWKSSIFFGRTERETKVACPFGARKGGFRASFTNAMICKVFPGQYSNKGYKISSVLCQITGYRMYFVFM